MIFFTQRAIRSDCPIKDGEGANNGSGENQRLRSAIERPVVVGEGRVRLQILCVRSYASVRPTRLLPALLTLNRYWSRPAQPRSPTSVKRAQKIGWVYCGRLEAVTVS